MADTLQHVAEFSRRFPVFPNFVCARIRRTARVGIAYLKTYKYLFLVPRKIEALRQSAQAESVRICAENCGVKS